ncbi:phospholipase D-like domain-containing protein [Ralstonia solanacearum]|uniref:phospholipase D-like domain-containing protein n=1 Tax=Ralstonia solanacearum TaxID=305 RepID=UPI001FEEF9B1|nr:phospholipase D-like domain-containing protein [Ralstonia solanacearum]
MSWAQAEAAAGEVQPRELDRSIANEKWEQYLTLLNLRNWDTVGGRPVTEQIYVHSKLLIADDRTVVLGSANINDRSQMGDRDSELAVIMHDDAPVSVPLDGKHMQRVGASAHNLRKALWRKHFGLMDGATPATELGQYWKNQLIQRRGRRYAKLPSTTPLRIRKRFHFCQR